MNFRILYDQSPPELKNIVISQWKAKQSPKYHPEGNTLKHIITVTNRAFKHFPDNPHIQLAAYFHDLGKLATAGVNPKTGQPTAYGHESEGVGLVDKYKSFITKMGADPDIVRYIVKNHMKIKPRTWDVMRQKKKDPIMNDPSFDNLMKFGNIDKGGLNLQEQMKLRNILNEIAQDEQKVYSVNYRDNKSLVNLYVKADSTKEAKDLAKKFMDKEYVEGYKLLNAKYLEQYGELELEEQNQFKGKIADFGPERVESLNEIFEYKDLEQKFKAELDRLNSSHNISITMGMYDPRNDRPDNDRLKGKGYGKISFIGNSEVFDGSFEKVINWVKQKGFEIEEESNYYEHDPGERRFYPSIKFLFDVKDIPPTNQ